MNLKIPLLWNMLDKKNLLWINLEGLNRLCGNCFDGIRNRPAFIDLTRKNDSALAFSDSKMALACKRANGIVKKSIKHSITSFRCGHENSPHHISLAGDFQAQSFRHLCIAFSHLCERGVAFLL